MNKYYADIFKETKNTKPQLQFLKLELKIKVKTENKIQFRILTKQ